MSQVIRRTSYAGRKKNKPRWAINAFGDYGVRKIWIKEPIQETLYNQQPGDIFQITLFQYAKPLFVSLPGGQENSPCHEWYQSIKVSLYNETPGMIWSQPTSFQYTVVCELPTSSCPSWAARKIGVHPSASWAFGSATASKSSRTAPICPKNAAWTKFLDRN